MTEKTVKLYDPDSILEIRRDVADGYLILLSGGRNSAAIIRSRSLNPTEPNRAQQGGGQSTINAQGEASSSPTDPNKADGGGQSNSQESTENKNNNRPNLTPDELSSLQLAFAALTDGNVIDAIFGAHSSGGVNRSKETSARAFAAAKAVKKALVNTLEDSKTPKAGQQPFFQLAVETYCHCFEIVIKYRIYVEEMGTLTWCWRHQKARQDAEKALEEAFVPLYQAMTQKAYIPPPPPSSSSSS